LGEKHILGAVAPSGPPPWLCAAFGSMTLVIQEITAKC